MRLPLLFLLLAQVSLAHDLSVTEQRAAGAVIMTCSYSGTEPAAYAAVVIFGPSDAKTEFQNGRTDARGRFVFLPDQAGEWRFIVDDELGHRVEKRVMAGVAASVPTGAQPVWQKLVLGLAVIGGASGILYGMKSRRPNRPQPISESDGRP